MLAVAACDDAAPGGGTDEGFRKNYVAARTALEEGHYDKASRGYLRLMPDAGPLAARLQLEYAHALLRSGAYADAADQARALAAATRGQDRAAAQAVAGTAEHELGLAALDSGDRAAARRHLEAARAAISEMLDTAPDLDPLGALTGRLASLNLRLAAL